MVDYQLWLGDCLQEMDRIEDGSIDAIIADLPYNVTNCHWDTLIPFEPLWKQYKRVIKRRGAIVLTASQPFTSMLVMSNLEWFKWEDVWQKTQATGHLNCKIMPMREHENILVFGLGKITFNPQMQPKPKKNIRPQVRGRSNIGDGSNAYGNFSRMTKRQIPFDVSYPRSVVKISNPNHGEKGLAPTQKPVALLSYLIKTYTNEGETVLDNTCGSGSTLEAAMRTGRHSIGIEKDAGYFQIASDRLAHVAAELRGELNHLPMFAEPCPELVEGVA